MAKSRGGSIYVSTDPNNIQPAFNSGGTGISIGPLGPTIYGGTGLVPSTALLLENGDPLLLENGDFLVTET